MLDTGAIETTPNHPFYTADRGWVEAGALKRGERIRTASGTDATVVSFTLDRHPASMWDITVAGAHSFFVGSGAVLVHNCGETWIGPHPASQMGQRGWDETTIEDTIFNPWRTHNVWDLHGGGRAPATAFERADGTYVVRNDATGDVIQISARNDPLWKPVWTDPRFRR